MDQTPSSLNQLYFPLSSLVYFNDFLIGEYHSRESDELNFLRYDLTQIRKTDNSSFERNIGFDFKNICVENYLNSRVCTLDQDFVDKLERVIGKVRDIELKEYIDVAESIIKDLQIPYRRFTTEQVRAFYEISVLQKRTMNDRLEYLVRGNLAEHAMVDMIPTTKRYSAGIMELNPGDRFNDEYLTVYINKEPVQVEIRSQRIFMDGYTYQNKRIEEQKEKIRPYVAFFNHIGMHIFYLTGILEKEFLLNKQYGRLMKATNDNERDYLIFDFPEYKLESYIRKNEDKTDMGALLQILKRRMSLDQFIKNIDDVQEKKKEEKRSLY